MIEELFQNDFIVKSAAAGIIVIAGFIIGHFFSKAVGLAMKKFGVSEKFRQKDWPRPEVFIENSIRYIIYALAIIAALTRLGIFRTLFNVAIFTIVAIVVILLVLNFKDLISNAIAKLLYARKDLQPGKNIKVDGISGKIVSVGVTEVKIITDKGNVMILPNAYLLKRTFIVKD